MLYIYMLYNGIFYLFNYYIAVSCKTTIIFMTALLNNKKNHIFYVNCKVIYSF